MPVLFALPVGLVLGLSLAWLARSELARSDAQLVLTRPFLVALSLGLLVYAPVVGYFAAFHGDWSYLYLVRGGRIPSAVDLVAVLTAGLTVPIGFAITAPWAIAKRGGRVLRVSAAAMAVIVIGAIVLSRRLSVSATYTQFHGHFGTMPIGKSPLGRGVLVSWLTLAAAYAWSAYGLRGQAPGRRDGGPRSRP